MKMGNTQRTKLLRALEHNDYEAVGENGILVEKMRFDLGGRWRGFHNGQLFAEGPNLVPAAFRSYALKAALAGFSQTSAWYVAPFINDVDPTSALTAANFEATLDEFTNYTEATRPAWTQGAESGQAISNAASLARITADTGGGTINGVVLISVATKGSAAGLLASAYHFDDTRTIQAGDTLDFEYEMQANEG